MRHATAAVVLALAAAGCGPPTTAAVLAGPPDCPAAADDQPPVELDELVVCLPDATPFFATAGPDATLSDEFTTDVVVEVQGIDLFDDQPPLSAVESIVLAAIPVAVQRLDGGQLVDAPGGGRIGTDGVEAAWLVDDIEVTDRAGDTWHGRAFAVAEGDRRGAAVALVRDTGLGPDDQVLSLVTTLRPRP